jgi:hypothetical protein
MTGNGIFCDADGNVYEGEFYKGKYNGFGQLVMNNEDMYIGQFSDGEFFGKGLLRKGIKSINQQNQKFKDLDQLLSHRQEIIDQSILESDAKEIYDGDFIANKKCGEGVLIVGNLRYEGIFMDDNFNKGVRILENGLTEEGYMKNGVFVVSPLDKLNVYQSDQSEQVEQ